MKKPATLLALSKGINTISGVLRDAFVGYEALYTQQYDIKSFYL